VLLSLKCVNLLILLRQTLSGCWMGAVCVQAGCRWGLTTPGPQCVKQTLTSRMQRWPAGSCCGPPSVLQGALYGDEEAPVWTREFQCGGNESALLDCRSSGSDRTTCSPGRAVGLTCSGRRGAAALIWFFSDDSFTDDSLVSVQNLSGWGEEPVAVKVHWRWDWDSGDQWMLWIGAWMNFLHCADSWTVALWFLQTLGGDIHIYGASLTTVLSLDLAWRSVFSPYLRRPTITRSPAQVSSSTSDGRFSSFLLHNWSIWSNNGVRGSIWFWTAETQYQILNLWFLHDFPPVTRDSGLELLSLALLIKEDSVKYFKHPTEPLACDGY